MPSPSPSTTRCRSARRRSPIRRDRSVGPCACTVTTAVPAFAASITASTLAGTSRRHHHLHRAGPQQRNRRLQRGQPGRRQRRSRRPARRRDATTTTPRAAAASTVRSLTWRLAIPSGTLIALTFTVTINKPDPGDRATGQFHRDRCRLGRQLPTRLERSRIAWPTPSALQSFTDTLTPSDGRRASGRRRHLHPRRSRTPVRSPTPPPIRPGSASISNRPLTTATYQNDATGAPTCQGSVLSWATGRSGRQRPDDHLLGEDRGSRCRRPPPEHLGRRPRPMAAAIAPPARRPPACASPRAVLVQSYLVTMTASTRIAHPGDKVIYTVSATNDGAGRLHRRATRPRSPTDLLGAARRRAATTTTRLAARPTASPTLAWGDRARGRGDEVVHVLDHDEAGGLGRRQAGDRLRDLSRAATARRARRIRVCAPDPVGLQAFTATIDRRAGPARRAAIRSPTRSRSTNAGTVAYTGHRAGQRSPTICRRARRRHLRADSVPGATYAGQAFSWRAPCRSGPPRP